MLQPRPLLGTAGPGSQGHAEQVGCPLPPACLCSPPPSRVQELQELERKLEDALGHQETAQLQRALDSQQQWAGSGPGLLNELEDADSERQVSTVLPRALSKSHRLLEHYQQR